MSDSPIIHELPPASTSFDVFRKLVSKPGCIFLDSALPHKKLGRYSFVAADPFEVVRFRPGQTDAVVELQQSMAQFTASRVTGLPPFQGGAAGVLGYELSREIERLPEPRNDEFAFPAICFGLYDVVVAFDHEQDKAWLVSQGFPEVEPDKRTKRAEYRAQQFLDWIQEPAAAVGFVPESVAEVTSPAVVTARDGVVSNFCKQGYQAAIEAAIEYIRAGDIFQVNLAQRLMSEATDHAANLYGRLRERSPATFAGYYDAGDFQIASASPERFVRVADGMVETRPIKGTRPTVERPEADMFSGEVLKNDAKERAENVMIVDLLRNDLSRVCDAESVKVTQLCGLEEYGYVQHLVSAVEGSLAEGRSVFDLIRASFPGGSITGAPKVRAMEIIAELEQTARGAYCGSLGYIGWNGTTDMNILIRTITAANGWWQMPVGGGITVRSDPKREYEETWHKAAGMLRALRK